MKGFDKKFVDFPAYILGITREIWEERGVGPALMRYYDEDILLRASTGMVRGNQGVVADTLQTLHEFPDRELVGEDVVWCGNDELGYLSSHRILSIKRHTGDGVYGKATGRVVRARTIAECWCRENRVVEEWLIRDQAAFARSLGMTPRELALMQAKSDLESKGAISYFTPDKDVRGAFRPVVEDGELAQRYADCWREVWGEKHPAAIRSTYHPGIAVEIPGGGSVNGFTDLDRFVVGYLASFPDAEFQIDQLMVNESDGQPSRLAMRFSISATHSGWGQFGMPSGAPIYILGLAQAVMVNKQITMEWLLIDEVAIWKQIIDHLGEDAMTLKSAMAP